MMRRITASWPLLVAAIFVAYSVLLLVNAFHSQTQLRADAEQRIIADSKRRAATVADLMAELRNGATVLAEAPEVSNYLVNKSLGMTLRYGLNANLYAIEERFRHQSEYASLRGARMYSRIVLFDEQGDVLVDLAPELGKFEYPRPAKGAQDLLIDLPSSRIVVSAPVMYKNHVSATVVAMGDLALLSRDMIFSQLKGNYREVLLSAEGDELPTAETHTHLRRDVAQALALLPEHKLTSSSELPVTQTLIDGSLAIRSSVQGSSLSLLTLLAEDEVYGQITSRLFLYAASLVPVLALVFALMFERVRRVGVALAQSEQRFHTIFEHIRDAILILDLDNSQIIEVNPRMLMMYGYAQGEVAGLVAATLGEHTPPYDEAAWLAKMATAHSSGPQFFLWHARRKDGALFWVEISMLQASINGHYRMLVVAHDVTQRKVQEQELLVALEYQRQLNMQLKEAQSQLLQSEKLASIGQLAAGVAHEINNPLGFISSNIGTLEHYVTQMRSLLDAYEQAMPHTGTQSLETKAVENIKQEIDLPYLKEDISSLLHETQDGVARVKKIVQDLRIFSHVDQAEWQSSDLINGLESTLNIAWNELKYKAEVVRDFAALPEVECMPAQLNQVFLNLLINAAQAIEQHGTISLRTSCTDEAVLIEISDTGCGIEPENLKRIFDPFFTTKPVGKGTGLGLSLSYGIVQKHHGSIEVQSQVGQGTAFKIRLPIKQPAAANLSASQTTPGENSQHPAPSQPTRP